MSLKLVLGIAAVLVGIMYSILENVIPVFAEINALTNGSIPSASTLSFIGTVGRAMTILLFGLLLLTGFLIGKKVDFRQEYGSILLVASAGAGIGCFVGYLVLVPGPDGAGLYLTFVMSTVLAIVAAIPFGLVTFAGAALADIRANPS